MPTEPNKTFPSDFVFPSFKSKEKDWESRPTTLKVVKPRPTGGMIGYDPTAPFRIENLDTPFYIGGVDINKEN